MSIKSTTTPISPLALLGSYQLTPGAGHKVTLAASSDGTTIADALLFVGAGAQPANLLYVHADDQGSPQKMTDASQATVWDGVFDPFGEEVATTGLAAMPLRFPGQYADGETGYSYNYLRDYEPALGRYIESDPIGMRGGANTYAYVGAILLDSRIGLVSLQMKARPKHTGPPRDLAEIASSAANCISSSA